MKIVEAKYSDKSKFEQLLDHYLSELKTHREINVGATDSKTYRYLDAYWQEKGRHPFLFYLENRLAGFSLIRDARSAESECYQVAEFYIVPAERLNGIGKKAAIAIFDLFPGNWELQIHCQNKTAIWFWEKCIKLRAESAPSVSRITAPDGRRLQYNFTI